MFSKRKMKKDQQESESQGGKLAAVGELLEEQSAPHDVELPSPEDAYHRELRRLEALVLRIEDRKIKKDTRAVIAAVKKLKADKEDDGPLAQRLLLTSNVLEAEKGLARETALQAYHQSAKRAQGKPHAGWKVLGGLMIVLGAALAGLAVACFLTPAVALGALAAVGAAGLIAGGAAVADKGRHKGLSKSMSNLEGHAEKCNTSLLKSR